MTFAKNPAGTGQDGQYELVAGYVALVLTAPAAEHDTHFSKARERTAVIIRTVHDCKDASPYIAPGCPPASSCGSERLGFSTFSDEDCFRSSSNLKRERWLGMRVKRCLGANGVMVRQRDVRAPAACLQ
jgi:hypothetical protein